MCRDPSTATRCSFDARRQIKVGKARSKGACFRRAIVYNIVMENSDKTLHIGLLRTVESALGGAGLKDPTQLGPLVLAYIGDTVFDLYVRSQLVLTTGLTAHGLHLAAAKRVCASAQAEAYRRIEGVLTDDEAAVYRRGRNGHMGTIPKNASIADYRSATGLEAVVGWLYLKGDDARLNELMRLILNEEAL